MSSCWALPEHKDVIPPVRKFQCGYNMVLWPSHLHDGTPTLARWHHLIEWGGAHDKQLRWLVDETLHCIICIPRSILMTTWLLPAAPCVVTVHKVVTTVKMFYAFSKHCHYPLLEHTLSTMKFCLCNSYFEIWGLNWLNSACSGIMQLRFAFKKQANQCVIASVATVHCKTMTEHNSLCIFFIQCLPLQ